MSEPYDGPDFKPEVQADDKKPEEALVAPPEGVLEGDPANASAFARDILASVVDEVIRRSKTAPADDDSTDNTDNGQLPTTIDSAPKSDDGQRPAPKSPPPYPGGDPCPFVSGSSPDSSSSLSIGSATAEVINELSQKPGGEHSSSETTLPKSELSGTNISNIHSNSESNVQVPDAKGAPGCGGARPCRSCSRCPFAVSPPLADTMPRPTRPSGVPSASLLPSVAPIATPDVGGCCKKGGAAQPKPWSAFSAPDLTKIAMGSLFSNETSQPPGAQRASIATGSPYAQKHSTEFTKDTMVAPRRSSLISILPLGPSPTFTLDFPNFRSQINTIFRAAEVQTSASVGVIPFSILRSSKSVECPSVGTMINALETPFSSSNIDPANTGTAISQSFGNSVLKLQGSVAESPDNFEAPPFGFALMPGGVRSEPGGFAASPCCGADASGIVANQPCGIAASTCSVAEMSGNAFNNPYGVAASPCCAAETSGFVSKTCAVATSPFCVADVPGNVQQSCDGIPVGVLHELYGVAASPSCVAEAPGVSQPCDVATSTCCVAEVPGNVVQLPCNDTPGGVLQPPCGVAASSGCGVALPANVTQSCGGISIPGIVGGASGCVAGNPGCAAAPPLTVSSNCRSLACVPAGRGCLGNRAFFKASRAHAAASAATACAAASVAAFGGCRQGHSPCRGRF